MATSCLTVSNSLFCVNFALGGAYPEKVNGLTKPYFGLPESTLEMIREGKVRMCVDWVRVMQ